MLLAAINELFQSLRKSWNLLLQKVKSTDWLSLNPLSCVLSFLFGTFIVFHQESSRCELSFKGVLLPMPKGLVSSSSWPPPNDDDQKLELYLYYKRRDCLLTDQAFLIWRPAGQQKRFINLNPDRGDIDALQQLLFSRSVYLGAANEDAFPCRQQERVSYGY